MSMQKLCLMPIPQRLQICNKGYLWALHFQNSFLGRCHLRKCCMAPLRQLEPEESVGVINETKFCLGMISWAPVLSQAHLTLRWMPSAKAIILEVLEIGHIFYGEYYCPTRGFYRLLIRCTILQVLNECISLLFSTPKQEAIQPPL